MTPKPEDIAREQIDRMLVSAGWTVQDAKAVRRYSLIREVESQVVTNIVRAERIIVDPKNRTIV